ncbi:hypothetical protein CEV32_4036 [Brucella rhizosphaerae]|uniref:Uncharacterized protein n=1 Tax=Brucella rhizosphaerae TaxID=571254 RepID=A0A256FRC5_9HYPH|nr:hypothetical protein CEV32_4036 [Brucella rhizosphaerae]
METGAAYQCCCLIEMVTAGGRKIDGMVIFLDRVGGSPLVAGLWICL